MKFLGKAFLVIIFISLYIPFLFSTSAKFQFLSPDYWINAFRAGNVYPNLEKILTKAFQEQAREEGANFQDSGILTSILTSGNLQDFIEKNLRLSLDFANGKSKELKFYIPTEVIPKGLLPAELMKNNEISPEKLSALFGPQLQQNQTQYQAYSQAGRDTLISFIVSLVILLGVLLLTYLITDHGKRLTIPGIALILSSLFTFLIILFVTAWGKGPAQEMILNEAEPAAQLLGTLGPPLAAPVLVLWRNIALGTLGLGAVFLFLKKPLPKVKKATKK